MHTSSSEWYVFNRYEVVSVLLQKGEDILDPDGEEYERQYSKEDELKYAKSRLNAYKVK